MAALFRVELQDGREAFQYLIGNLNIPTLLEPGIPGNTHTNQLGQLFSSEALRSPPLKWWQMKLFWMQTRTTILQKIGQSRAVFDSFSHAFLVAPRAQYSCVSI
ncbi:hypothetical protein KSC_001240 [Ktedonobacter sp. SOSP1-52]|nr:hypothetical protein KSC_001240 [Ktedonobacter sp. SOSP1-52]